jgi:hypothetical protein
MKRAPQTLIKCASSGQQVAGPVRITLSKGGNAALYYHRRGTRFSAEAVLHGNLAADVTCAAVGQRRLL